MAKEFNTIIWLFAIFSVIEVVRVIVQLMARKNEGLRLIVNILRLNWLLAIGTWIALIVMRLRYVGKVCSGAYVDNDLIWQNVALWKRGKLLLALVIISFIFIAGIIVGGILMCVFKRR